MNSKLILLSSLILIAAFGRIIPHPNNMSTIAAMGLLGSAYFSRKWMALLIPFLASWLSDLFFNNLIYPELFERLKSINQSKNYLPELKVRGKAANSDHYPFSEKGVPAFFMYSLGGPGFYHDVDDKASTLSLARFPEIYRLILDFLRGF
jgi:hypothetical protein